MKIRRSTDTGEWTTRRYLSLLGNILIWAIVAIDGFYLWPTSLHGSTSMVIVSGHSMDPTYFTGDLVIARKMEPSVGDVIVYAPAGLGGSQIVHRIIGGNATDGWQMQGDNNDFIDPFTPKGSEVRGVVLVHYANFGRVTVLLLNPVVWALVLLAAIVLLLWYTGDDCEERQGDDDDKGKGKGEGDPEPEPEPEAELDLIDRVVEGTEAAVARLIASGADAGAAMLATLTRPSRVPRHAAAAPRFRASATLRRSAIVAVLGLVAVFGQSSASASQLIVKAGSQASVMTVAKCATQTLTATKAIQVKGNHYGGVLIGNLDQACQGLSITVALYRTDRTLVTTGSGTVTSASTMVPTGGNYRRQEVGAAIVTINGWPYVAAWGDTTPPAFYENCLGDVTWCTIAVANNPSATLQTNGGGTWQVVQIQVSGQSPNTTWTADIDLLRIPGVTVYPTQVWSDGGVTVTGCSTTKPVLHFASDPYQFYITLYIGTAPSWVTPNLCR